MSAGKVAAQAAHATAQLFGSIAAEDAIGKWIMAPHKTVIVLEARDQQHLTNIDMYMYNRGIECRQVIDEGANEVPSHSMTALISPVMDKNDETDKLMSTFNTYSDKPMYTVDASFIGGSIDYRSPFIKFNKPTAYSRITKIKIKDQDEPNTRSKKDS